MSSLLRLVRLLVGLGCLSGCLALADAVKQIGDEVERVVTWKQR